MMVFPQLTSGAVAQFPWRKFLRFRTVRNRPRSGEEIELDDIAFEERRWELPFSDLTDAEWQALEDLHAASQGARSGFTFLEPGANLLNWSENFTQQAWAKSVGLSLTPGISDPFGGARAWELSAGSAMSLSQSLSAPGSYRLIGSAWVRTNAVGVELRLSDGLVTRSEAVIADGVWRPVEALWPGGSAQDAIVIELAGAAGTSLEVYGMQAEAQVSRSAYKRTGARGGVFENARLADDRLEQRLAGPNSHSTTVRIVWTPSSI